MQNLRQFARKINIEPSRLRFDEAMALHTTFRIGGPADLYLRIESEAEFLRLAEAARTEGLPLFILGGGANILVGDLGIRGVVADLGGLSGCRFTPRAHGIRAHGITMGGTAENGAGTTNAGTTSADDGATAGELVAGSGITIDALCLEALARNLAGLEDFFGMPGTLGGAVFMNARCYDAEMSTRLAWVRYADRDGRIGRLKMNEGGWAYKKSPFQPGGRLEGATVLEAAFGLREGDASKLGATMRARRADRVSKGHFRLPSAGSVFKNNRAFGRPTGAILDSLGFRGRRIGAAAVSGWHANIFVNEGGASAADMRALIELAQRSAKESLGIALEPEVLFVGDFYLPGAEHGHTNTRTNGHTSI